MKNLRATPVILLFTAVAFIGGCDSQSAVAPSSTTSVNLSLSDSAIEVGELSSAAAVAVDQSGDTIDVGPVTYASGAQSIAAINPTTGEIFALSTGVTQITATIGTTTAQRTIRVSRFPVVINEITPNGDGPGGWVELFNSTDATVDISGMTIGDLDASRSFDLPQGTTVPSGGFFVIDESSFPGGLGAHDAIHLYSRFGVQIEAHQWLESPATSFGRCPTIAGPFVITIAATRGASNSCPPVLS